MNINQSFTKNKTILPLNIHNTNGNFLNLKKIIFVPTEKFSKMKQLKSSQKNIQLNLSGLISKNDKNKDELIDKLYQKISMLENKIKSLKKELNKKSMTNKTLILKNNMSYKSLNPIGKISSIPLDKNLLKSKFSKSKKLFDLIEANKKLKSNKNNSVNMNNSFSSYTCTKSYSRSALKSNKKPLNLKLGNNIINNIQNILLGFSSKTSKNKKFSTMENKVQKNSAKKKDNNKTIGQRKIIGIPTKIRRNNASPKMMNSTNYSNTISNLVKDENLKKISKKNDYETISFPDMKNKLDNIRDRTKNLLEKLTSINIKEKTQKSINKKNIKFRNIQNYYKILSKGKTKI